MYDSLTEEEMLEEVDATFRHIPWSVQERILKKAKERFTHPVYMKHHDIDPDSCEDFLRTLGRVMGMYPLESDIVRMRELDDVSATIYKGVVLENTGIRLAELPDGMGEKVHAKAKQLLSNSFFINYYRLGEYSNTTYSWTLNYVMDHPELLQS